MLERILKLMLEQNINKNKLAKLASLPATTIYSALSSEENLQKAKLETIKSIATALSTTLDYIVNGEQNNTNAQLSQVVITNYNGQQCQFCIKNDDLDLIIPLLQKLHTKEQ